MRKWPFIQGVRISKYLIPFFFYRPNFRLIFILSLGDMFLIGLRDHISGKFGESDIHRLAEIKLITNSGNFCNF